ncbi:MAG: hypothetical protein IT280_09170 [Ignavibacteria bacterium]|nr:hypothetical protein [Ignavibacteria bacterium]
MLEELLKLVGGEAGEQIINNPQIPNEHNDAAVNTTTESIIDGLKGQIASGNGADVLSLLGGKSSISGNPLVGSLTNNVTNSLMEKIGITNPVAKQIAAALVPVVISKLVSKTNNPNDSSFDINSIFGSLTDGKSDQFDLGSLLGGSNTNSEQSADLGSIFNILSGK